MGTEAELNVGVAKFKIDLSEFTSAMKGLIGAAIGAAIGANEKEGARDAMKELISEASKTFETITQTLAPFYALTNDKKFATEFAAQHASFKATYLQQKVRTHCSIVEAEFSNLQKRRSWMAHVPVAQKAYADLQSVCDRWLFQDNKIVGDMEAFFRNLDKFMLKIAALNSTNPRAAFKTFMAGLKPIERNFLAMKKQLGELQALSRKL